VHKLKDYSCIKLGGAVGNVKYTVAVLLGAPKKENVLGAKRYEEYWISKPVRSAFPALINI
jgi:hypothetical protein